MNEARDIVRISIPFAAGVWLASVFGAMLFASGGSASMVVALLALGGIVALIFHLCRVQSTHWILLALLFLCLGIFCGENANMLGLDGIASAGLASKALERLSSLIDSIPFAHKETNALLRALLTGQRDMLSRDVIASFREAGAAHILALSGLHLGVIYLIISKMLSVIGRSRLAFAIRSLLIIAFSLFYVLMTGASPSIVRAFLFITLGEFARHSPGRRKDPLGIWCTALLIQLAVLPGVISSLGFQLSYLAMLGIFTVFPWLDGFYPRSEGILKHDPMRKLWSAVALTCSCQLFTAPLVWLRFHTFPKYFILTNLIALPLTEGLIFCGVASLILGVFGLHPHLLLWATDSLAQALQNSLSIISGM